eukprot:CAMPEP_0181117856 /NCGR_PEP_ID=MMETSP1071-20121207/22759_1 /TAXON_ID=35127 /ORGANISM="Thalassiosira sp., Strain NH16" /LENGTH=304 /DNA_ID=CAMNT_0023202299 /DNA_START=21 /DNA_END=936 /DNA_ORIENTATION=-
MRFFGRKKDASFSAREAASRTRVVVAKDGQAEVADKTAQQPNNSNGLLSMRKRVGASAMKSPAVARHPSRSKGEMSPPSQQQQPMRCVSNSNRRPKQRQGHQNRAPPPTGDENATNNATSPPPPVSILHATQTPSSVANSVSPLPVSYGASPEQRQLNFGTPDVRAQPSPAAAQSTISPPCHRPARVRFMSSESSTDGSSTLVHLMGSVASSSAMSSSYNTVTAEDHRRLSAMGMGIDDDRPRGGGGDNATPAVIRDDDVRLSGSYLIRDIESGADSHRPARKSRSMYDPPPEKKADGWTHEKE